MSFFRKSERLYNKGFVHSVNAALEGVVHTLKTERNMRLHFLVGFFVLIAGIYFNITGVEFMLLCFSVTFVLVSEMFNTVVEHAIDLIKSKYHPKAKIIKDIAAGAVFVSSINAAIMGYLLLFRRYISGFINGAFYIVKQSSWHVTLIILLLVIGLVLLIKIIRKEKILLRGGMPSGHAAVAFAVWVVLSLATENALVCVLVFLLAALIAKSRMVNRVHTLIQVITGSILGAVTAFLLFQLLS